MHAAWCPLRVPSEPFLRAELPAAFRHLVRLARRLLLHQGRATAHRRLVGRLIASRTRGRCRSPWWRPYLGCGDFSRGFVHVKYTSRGDAMAVAFSCKLRGLCPSYGGRRMAGAKAAGHATSAWSRRPSTTTPASTLARLTLPPKSAAWVQSVSSTGNDADARAPRSTRTATSSSPPTSAAAR